MDAKTALVPIRLGVVGGIVVATLHTFGPRQDVLPRLLTTAGLLEAPAHLRQVVGAEADAGMDTWWRSLTQDPHPLHIYGHWPGSEVGEGGLAP